MIDKKLKLKIERKTKSKRNKIMKKYNFTCVDCGYTPRYNDPRRYYGDLQIHHIKYTLENLEENCVVLCKSCHIMRHDLDRLLKHCRND